MVAPLYGIRMEEVNTAVQENPKTSKSIVVRKFVFKRRIYLCVIVIELLKFCQTFLFFKFTILPT